jgi:hypothetical protein
VANGAFVNVKLVPLMFEMDDRVASPVHDSDRTLTFHCDTVDVQQCEYGAAVHPTVTSSSPPVLTVMSMGAAGGTVPADEQGVTELDCALTPPGIPDALVADTKNEYDVLDNSAVTIVDKNAVGVVPVDTGTVMLLSLPSDANTRIEYDVTGMLCQGTELDQVTFADRTSAIAVMVAGAEGGCSMQ